MAEMVSTNDLKPGMTFIHEGNPYLCLESHHNKTAMAKAVVKVRAKNLSTGANIELAFRGGDKLEKAFVEKKKYQFLYVEGTMGTFMDDATFEQIEIPTERIKWELNFLTEGNHAHIIFFDGKILGVEIPVNMAVKVQYTVDAVKGNTVNAAMKKATLETGFELDVPQFISTGEKIAVNTVDGTYISKA